LFWLGVEIGQPHHQVRGTLYVARVNFAQLALQEIAKVVIGSSFLMGRKKPTTWVGWLVSNLVTSS
jgi:hypothetical protein